MGGAILNSVPQDDEPSSLDMAGSTLVVVAESKAEVVEVLKKDIYATSGVWDVDNARYSLSKIPCSRLRLLTCTGTNRLRCGPSSAPSGSR